MLELCTLAYGHQFLGLHSPNFTQAGALAAILYRFITLAAPIHT